LQVTNGHELETYSRGVSEFRMKGARVTNLKKLSNDIRPFGVLRQLNFLSDIVRTAKRLDVNKINCILRYRKKRRSISSEILSSILYLNDFGKKGTELWN
jgi:hypothetical protein